MSVSLANCGFLETEVSMVSRTSTMALGANSPPLCTSPEMVLSPNQIKIEPKFVHSPMSVGNGLDNGIYRQANHDWMPSPRAHMTSPTSTLSPVHGLSSHVNGHHPGSVSIGKNGFSPLSSSSYETFSPNGKEEMSPPSNMNGYSNFGDSKGKKKGPVGRQQDDECLVCGDRASGYHYNALTCEGCKGKEEISPPGNMNGYSNFGDSKGKKKGPIGKLSELKCLVCGDNASGYHYNALTCEGCKGFFRRSITKKAVYQCKYGGNCDIDMYMRRKCQQCRLTKCFRQGMRADCVVPEAQCVMKRESKRAQKEKDKPNSTTKEPTLSKSYLGKPDYVFSKMMPEEQKELISRLCFFQEEYESPSVKDLQNVTEFQLGEDNEDTRLQHVTEITILTVQLIVEFSKRLPGFETIRRDDQITLLKACSSEVMMLRCARKYDINTDSIVFANNQPYTRENYFSACVGDSADAIFSFCKSLCLMKVDNAEFALLTALVIFSGRPGLIETNRVEKIQSIYVDALRNYVQLNQDTQIQKFSKLICVLGELRTLGNANLEMCFSLKVKNKNLPAFLAEIWDIQT